MKKWLIAGGLALSMSYVSSVHAVDPTTAAVAASTAAEVAAAEGVVAAGVATAASVVSSGVAAAVASPLVGVAGGAGTAYLMNDHLFNKCANDKQCDAAKQGTYWGAGVGSAGVVGAALLAGLDTAGLAAIGAAVGGGAVAGASTLVLAPVVAAVAVGYGAYWWFSDDKVPAPPSETAPK
ncbi:hypothetical protein [Candidatus Parabeggiatoa sp. HSG14]|uniref:hypothetical protein n=1 Tax=Candidatus Parabeggiatoa sp. HSG14 TaxID=3055593 RepID=UPI0025A7CA2F|nr:hypothetical protein [Thiotrichales bacterium HSG14]